MEESTGMTAVFAILMIIVISSARIKKTLPSEQNHMTMDAKVQIEGIFTFLIVISHYVGYMQRTEFDTLYMTIRHHLNQAVVVPFLFYSGYGVMVSYMKKGRAYLQSIVRKRVPRVWFLCAVCVCFYIIMRVAYGGKLEVRNVLLSFTGWESVGNSNWYIFAVLGSYLIFYISMMLFSFVKQKGIVKYGGLLLNTPLSAAFVLWIRWCGKEVYYFNTILMFPLGCWYAALQDRIDRLFDHDLAWYGAMCAVGVLYMISYMHREPGLSFYTLWCSSFMAFILLLSMRIELNSHVLRLFGSHVFSIYILQRIPMYILHRAGMIVEAPYMSFALVILFTLLIAILFDKVSKPVLRALHLN